MTAKAPLPYSENLIRPSYIRDGRAPIPDREITSRIMSSIRGKNTRPELELKLALRKAGAKGIISHLRDLPGRPDIAFRNRNLAIFVHGCFWHQCPYCKPSLPKSHKTFWKKKFIANKRRDSAKVAELKALGWSSLTVWECQWKKSPGRQLARILKAMNMIN
jgi:DNA mismatch endonuclease (patch repair protein)